MSELKSCPFCGGDAELMVDELNGEDNSGTVMCMTCYTTGPTKDDWKDALTAWNTRADDWQPIETAPHNKEVLLYCPERHSHANKERIELGFASHGERGTGWSSVSSHSWATHWKPRPTPPGDE